MDIDEDAPVIAVGEADTALADPGAVASERN
jgi:hypothetical protein